MLNSIELKRFQLISVEWEFEVS